MEEKRTSSVWTAITLLVVLPVGAYVGGYFIRSKSADDPRDWRQQRRRLFATQFEAKLFSPAAKVETLATGLSVSTEVDGPYGSAFYP